MLYIDDKARGVHEGYLLRPITKLELVFGLNIAAPLKATLSGISIVVIGRSSPGWDYFHPIIMMQTLCLSSPAHAFNGNDVSAHGAVAIAGSPRHVPAVLNVLLLYPSAPMYPTASFPKWMQV